MHWAAHFQNIPQQWEIYLNHPSGSYDTIVSGDNGNFVLSGSVDPNYPEKMIFGMAHNNTTGHGFLTYTIYPTNNPADSLHMVFDITISPGTPTAIAEQPTHNPLVVTDKGTILLPSKQIQTLHIYNLQGQLLWEVQPNGEQQIAIPTHLKGILLIQAQTTTKTYHTKIYR